jgi:hypothetical protein
LQILLALAFIGRARILISAFALGALKPIPALPAGFAKSSSAK